MPRCTVPVIRSSRSDDRPTVFRLDHRHFLRDGDVQDAHKKENRKSDSAIHGLLIHDLPFHK
jgi:hypothetical protein